MPHAPPQLGHAVLLCGQRAARVRRRRRGPPTAPCRRSTDLPTLTELTGPVASRVVSSA